MKYQVKYDELRQYLKLLSYKDFHQRMNGNNDGIIKEGHSIRDIEYFNRDKSKIPLDKVIDYGMPFMLDAIGNDISVVFMSRRKYKLPTGRAINAKFGETLITDCRKLYGTSLSGYWMVPDEFIIKTK